MAKIIDLLFNCLFSGDSTNVFNILQVMCLTKEPEEWKVPILDENLCKERALPLNRSGETPLEVAKLAGFYEEISIVYKYLELPLTIEPSMKRKYNPEPMNLRPWELECQKDLTNNPHKKRKNN